MQERIVELITIVLQELKKNVKIADIDIDSLMEKGYTSSEISTAFSWLVDRIEFDKDFLLRSASDENSFRMLHEAEDELFTQDGWGEMIQLKALGIIDSENVEELIESFMVRGIYKADPRFIKRQIWQKVIEGSFKVDPGSRIVLKGNDTIN